jgi:hypothetical protein
MLVTSLIALNVLDDMCSERISLCQVSLQPSTKLPATVITWNSHLETIDSSKTSRSKFHSIVHTTSLYQRVHSTRRCKLSCSCSFCLKMHENAPKLSQVSPTAIITYDSDIKHRKDIRSSFES